jgi:hypothetical protein
VISLNHHSPPAALAAFASNVLAGTTFKYAHAGTFVCAGRRTGYLNVEMSPYGEESKKNMSYS